MAVDVTMTIRGDGASAEGAPAEGAPPDASVAPPPLPLDSAAAEGTTTAADMAAGEEAAEDGEARAAEAVAAEAAGLAGQATAQAVPPDDGESSDGKTAGAKTEQEKAKDRAEGKVDGDAAGETADKTAEKIADGQGSDLERLMTEAAPSLNAAPTAPQGDRIRNYIQRMMADNDLKMSRYREADEFGRRVEAVLATAKSIIAEAKAANELDQAEERRKARRESFKDYDKIVEESQDNVNELRQAAFGSSTTLKDFVEAMTDPNGTDGGSADPESVGAESAVTPSADSLSALGGAETGMPALSGSVNLLA
ncbi:hypothetical protein D3869_16285 (plasmid) [Azospirillum brasilense]|uniref:Uncharacterized protein n=1 Tax=Azospirillum brasilense TaxID=192 RepID=A0A4D8R5G6_AZOBR|nr:hypothetical protein D3869_16285 [Azospirillum brasilense]